MGHFKKLLLETQRYAILFHKSHLFINFDL